MRAKPRPRLRASAPPVGPILGGLLCVTLAVASLAPVAAQYHGATDGVALPTTSILQQDDAVAAEVNPAFIGYLPDFSLAYVHAEVDQRDQWLGRGDAVHFATPLFFNFAAGLSLQSVRPRSRAYQPLGARATRAQAALSLAFSPADSLSLGLTTRGITSTSGLFDGVGVVDLGLSLRPSSVLSLWLVGRDLFVSREGFGTAGLDLGTVFEAGAQVRPFGVEDLVLDVGVATRFDGQVAGRGGVGLRVPGVGYATAMAEVERLGDEDAALRLVAELAVSYGSATASFGAMTGDGFDGDRLDWVAMARVEGVQRAGVPVGGYVLNLELTGLSPRRMLATAIVLERARLDPRVRGVLLRPRESEMGSAYAQELRLQIASLRAAGKAVVCHLDSASGAEYYACSGADEVLVDPAGSVRFMGGSARVLLFGGTLEKLGVRADFIRIGEYKSAPEQFTETAMSPPAREQLAGLLDDVHLRILQDVASDLGVTAERVAALMDGGPHLAADAQDKGMVAGVADEVSLPTLTLGGMAQPRLVEQIPPQKDRWNGAPARIGVVVVDGAIVDGESVDVPFLGTHMSGSETVIGALDGLAADPSVRAIVLRVDSPGGSVLASDRIWRAVDRAREQKPVVASLGAVAASGGYYVAAAADEIWADPSTVTGSIGIFYGKVDVSPLAAQLGVSVEHLKRGKRAGAESMWRSFTADERAALAERLRSYYRMFLERVHEGRGMSVEQVDRLARGRIYSGDAARQLGLVDALGGLASALRRARELSRLGADAPVVVLPEAPGGLLQFLLGQTAGAPAPAVADLLPADTASLGDAFSVLRLLDGSEAMALMPLDIDL